ncbi:MAG TPA: hypothetical protein VE549_14875, partial [Myxococcaceae bacterium]|nr:hypothetical protein [Myxococcaceae bacterium]
TTLKTETSTFAAGKETVLLQVRDEDGDVGYAAKRIFVAADSTIICSVTTAADVDDNAQDCGTSFGPDGKLSLREAVRIANTLRQRHLIEFDLPVSSVLAGASSGSAIEIDEEVRIAGSPGVTLGRELVIKSTGQARISGLAIGPGTRLNLLAGAKLDITDCEFRGAEPIRVEGQLKARRTVFRDCQDACISGEGGDVHIEQSSFVDGAVGIDLVTCPLIPLEISPVLDLAGNTFVGFATAIQVGLSCERPTNIVHQTFYRNTVAISYEGGQQHVLQNNIFSEQTVPVLGCEDPSLFLVRSNHALHANTLAGCLSGDPGVISFAPRFAAPSAGDFRLIYGSPLIDAAPAISDLDLNGPAPDLFFGTGPDYGGRETY